MAIELRDNWYYLAMFFVEPTHNPISGALFDMMGILYKESVDSSDPVIPYRIKYRFRYYKDAKVFDSMDERSWYELTSDGSRSEKEAIESLRQFCSRLQSETKLKYPSFTKEIKSTVIECRGNGSQMVELLAKQPFCHFRPVEEGEEI